jgi:putative hydrolase of the HAD superfamily
VSPYRALIFDLGKVLVDVDFERIFPRWADLNGSKADELRERFQVRDLYHPFERGEISAPEFRRIVRSRLGLELNDEEFDDGFNQIFLPLRHEVEALVGELRRSYRLVVLSNTNEIHAREWKKLYAGFLRSFERVFCSNEMRARKPERKAFEIVLEYLGTSPGETVFLDDLEINVEGARDLGCFAIQVRSTEQMIDELKRAGIL